MREAMRVRQLMREAIRVKGQSSWAREEGVGRRRGRGRGRGTGEGIGGRGVYPEWPGESVLNESTCASDSSS